MASLPFFSGCRKFSSKLLLNFVGISEIPLLFSMISERVVLYLIIKTVHTIKVQYNIRDIHKEPYLKVLILRPKLRDSQRDTIRVT
jgi:hypothetical protein